MTDPVPNLKEFRYTGSHAGSLEGGRAVEPGEFTGPIDPDLPTHAQMIEDGQLIEGSAPKPDKSKKREGESQ